MADPKADHTNLVNRMLHEVFAIVAQEHAEHGHTHAQEMVYQFLAQYVGTCIINSLLFPAETAPPGVSEEAKFTLSWANYQEEKRLVEGAIAEGFRQGWMAYDSELDPEMICEVHTVSTTPSDPKISH
jgi:hypothetical protein